MPQILPARAVTRAAMSTHTAFLIQCGGATVGRDANNPAAQEAGIHCEPHLKREFGAVAKAPTSHFPLAT